MLHTTIDPPLPYSRVVRPFHKAVAWAAQFRCRAVEGDWGDLFIKNAKWLLSCY